ncbi:MAG: hypothetical protein P9M03_05135 [Candidatus Theseobacter exili]|nr:hypothetical protein [Candidatus Theseobacter exili]
MESYKKYGDFSEDKTEFVITDPATPRPWINYLSNGEYCTLISQGSGGYSYFLDSGVNRLTRWLPSAYLTDKPGRFLYIRDDETDKYWSNGFQPVKKGDFLCRHGLGYTILSNKNEDIESEVSYFVPLSDSLEVWLVKIKNNSSKTRKISVFPFVEWLLGDWATELAVRNISILLNRGSYDESKKAVIASKFPWKGEEWPFHGYIGASFVPDSYDIEYEDFIGRYRDYADPIAVEKGICSNSTDVKGVNMVGALHKKLSLEPGQTEEFSVIVGISDSDKKTTEALDNYRDLNYAKEAFQKTKDHWRKLILGNIIVDTPDDDFNAMTNVWMKYQVIMNNHWGRSATYYHEGGGEFGYRNTAQDAWGMTPIDPGYTKDRLIMLAHIQKNTGQPLPGWSLSDGPSTHRPPSDFPIWLPFLLIKYVKETGDFSILDQQVDYYDGGSASMYEHAKKATEFLQDIDRSERGLPLMGTQDWNDAFDRTGIRGKGESVWLGMGLCVALKNLEELATHLNDDKTASDCRERYEKMKAIVNEHAWDGDRYCYAFNDDGVPIGSKSNKEGSIQLNSQTWAILAGIPDDDKLEKILKLLDEDLVTPFGPPLFKPEYTEYDDTIGRITAFAPGTKENAALFCHGGTFKVIADLSIRRSKEAFETFKQVLPCDKSKDIEVMKTEPYVFPEYYIGLGNRHIGEGAFTWLTGSADWAFIAAIDWIMGVRPEFDGLLIDPQIPAEWKKCGIKRNFRNAEYDVIIEDSQGVGKGVKLVEVDGEPIDGNLIRPHSDGKTHKVRVVLG